MGSFSGLGTFKSYTAACGSCASALCSLLPWCSRWTSFFPSLSVDVRRRIELIQDFEMPTVCTTIKVSKDGQYILATGKHLCGCDLHVLHSRKCCSGKGHPLCLPQCLLINTFRCTETLRRVKRAPIYLRTRFFREQFAVFLYQYIQFFKWLFRVGHK